MDKGTDIKLNHNVAAEFFRTADKRGADAALFFKGRRALGELDEESLLFAELAKIAKVYACEFRKAGLRRGDKTLVMLRYSPEFICAVFALFSLGAAPVLIDPGMGFSRLLHCISKTKPRGLVAIPLVHWAAFLKRRPFVSVELSFSVAGILPPFCGALRLPSLSQIMACDYSDDIEALEMGDSDLAAIVFTTGSTGPAKGVEYTHGIFNAQLKMIKKYYGAGPDHKDMPCFPLFAMFSLCLGMPCVIPDIDPSRPAQAAPEKIIDTIIKHEVSFSFASPALWRRVSEHCILNKIKLNPMKKALMAGAPVPAYLHEAMKKVMPDGAETIVPYGATEALPIANFTGSEMLSETSNLTAEGKGYCVGYPVSECEIRIVEPVDGAIRHIVETKNLPVGEIGEIIVKGTVVTRHYHDNHAADQAAKIADDERGFWHRMGDMGYFDRQGRLWFCGRKSHVVHIKAGAIYPAALEAPFNSAAGRRCAIVGIGERGSEIPVLVVEGFFYSGEFEALRKKFENITSQSDAALRISHFTFMKKFPVDIRHNAKISREKIRECIEKKKSNLFIC